MFSSTTGLQAPCLHIFLPVFGPYAWNGAKVIGLHIFRHVTVHIIHPVTMLSSEYSKCDGSPELLLRVMHDDKRDPR